MTSRVPRQLEELLGRLADHCNLLVEYHERACRQGEARYLGEIAGKLRVLTQQSRQNRPLLLDLMKHFGVEVPITIDRPGGAITMTLSQYLARLACVIRLPSGELAELSNSDLIALWAQQAGASHEDWALDQRLATIFAGGLFVNGQPIHGTALCGICRTVLHVARRFQARIQGEHGGRGA